MCNVPNLLDPERFYTITHYSLLITLLRPQMAKNLTIILLLVITSVVTACGNKGPVRPKLLPLPAAPVALAVEQRGDDFLLSWGIPQRNQDGSPLTDLQGFRIERMSYQPGEDCPDCREEFRPAAEIDLEYLRHASRLGDRLFWWDIDPAPGQGYRYRVLPVTRRGQLGAPAKGLRLFVPPPPPPTEVTAAGQDRLVRLSWQAPAEPAAEIVGYNVYRRGPGDPPPLQPANGRPVAATSFDDFGLKNGQTYLYTVATVIQIRGVAAESAPTAEIEARPTEGR